MKKTIISALLLIAGQLLHAQLKFDWAASFGNTSTEVLNDAVLYGGKYYVAGYFTGTLDLNPGPGVFQITSANGKNNAFLACYTADGQFIRGAGFTGNGTSNILKIQAEGSLLILGGNVTGSIDFDPGRAPAITQPQATAPMHLWYVLTVSFSLNGQTQPAQKQAQQL